MSRGSRKSLCRGHSRQRPPARPSVPNCKEPSQKPNDPANDCDGFKHAGVFRRHHSLQVRAIYRRADDSGPRSPNTCNGSRSRAPGLHRSAMSSFPLRYLLSTRQEKACRKQAEAEWRRYSSRTNRADRVVAESHRVEQDPRSCRTFRCSDEGGRLIRDRSGSCNEPMT